MNYFVTAIGTDSGKTLVSAILCHALRADYWKPVQAGFPTDSQTVSQLLRKSNSKIHRETYVFKTAASPHAASALEGIKIRLDDFVEPNHFSDLVIEGAGGCLVPLNDEDLVIDLVSKFEARIILVSNLYLGSINHTLLTYEAITQRKLPLLGIIFNGPKNDESERVILHRTGMRCLLRIDREKRVNEAVIKKYSQKFLERWNG